MTPDQMEGFLRLLTDRLDATNPNLDKSALWRILNKHVSATIAQAREGKLGEADIIEAYNACIEYENNIGSGKGSE